MCIDICGPLQPPVITGDIYFATTDVGSRYTFVIPIKTRADAVQSIQDALKYAEQLTG